MVPAAAGKAKVTHVHLEHRLKFGFARFGTKEGGEGRDSG